MFSLFDRSFFLDGRFFGGYGFFNLFRGCLNFCRSLFFLSWSFFDLLGRGLRLGFSNRLSLYFFRRRLNLNWCRFFLGRSFNDRVFDLGFNLLLNFLRRSFDWGFNFSLYLLCGNFLFCFTRRFSSSRLWWLEIFRLSLFDFLLYFLLFLLNLIVVLGSGLFTLLILVVFGGNLLGR